MPARRLPLGLLAPIALLVLVTALGVLQYRWVGQVSEAERDQMKQSLDRRAREFADEFDKEIARAYQTFRVPAGFDPAAPDAFVHDYDEWHNSARFPSMLKTAYVAKQNGSDFELHHYVPESHTFARVDWPKSLERVRVLLIKSASISPPAAAGLIVTAAPVLPDVPALVIGESSVATNQTLDKMHVPGGSSVSATFTFEVKAPPQRYAVLELDRDVLTTTVIPSLAERVFPDSGSDRFRMQVRDGASSVLYSRGIPSGTKLDVVKADAVSGLFGLGIQTVRSTFSTMRGQPAGQATVTTWSAVSPSTGGQGALVDKPAPGTVIVTKPAGRPAELQKMMPVSDQLAKMVIEEHAAATLSGATARTSAMSGWTLLLQHSAGSLDAAVDRARHRNLWLSFGILGVLVASAGLVFVNARRSEKLAAQQLDFVATVSHELRTPVAVIRSAAQNLAAGVVHDPDQARRYGDLIEAEGRRLTDMVEQVLEYAGLSDAKRQRATRPVDTGTLVRDIVSASESLPEAGSVTFEVRVDESAPAVMADEDAIRRAVLNLIGNALKYGADGGWIGVSVARGTGRDDGYVSIAVADRGRGIAAEDLGEIFKPFYRGSYARDRQIRGNGLGLSLVKRIVDAHGGRVSVKSAPGEGATFTLHLPYAANVAAGTAAPVKSGVAIDGDSLTALRS